MALTAALLPGAISAAQAKEGFPSRGGEAAVAPAGAAADLAAVADGSVNAAGVNQVKWHACTTAPLQGSTAVCGTITVPMDYRKPGGSKVHLAVSMVRHTVSSKLYQGVMLVNPGGPGGSGLVYSNLGDFVPNGAGKAYDWIGFDPRGVGASTPKVICNPSVGIPPRPPYNPTTYTIQKEWLARSKAYATACKDHNSATMLANLKTVDIVRDMDAMRVALGQSKINFYGFSYGTYLGQVYATRYPNRVRRMVLDANVDPRRVWYGANLDQDVAFEKVFKIFLGWVAKYDSSYHLGSTEAIVEKNWYAQRDAFAKAPGGGAIGGSEWADIFLASGYGQWSWVDLAAMWSTYNTDKNALPLIVAYAADSSAGDDNGLAVYNAVQCTDVAWPKSWATWKADNTRLNATAPFLTWANAWFNAPCLYWPAKAGLRPVVSGKAAPPVLLISETLDAATPYTGSLEVRRRFPKSRLIAVLGGTTHANSLSGNACVDDRVAAYLATGKLPSRATGNRADVACAAPAQPVPPAPPAPTPAAGPTPTPSG